MQQEQKLNKTSYDLKYLFEYLSLVLKILLEDFSVTLESFSVQFIGL